MSMKFSVQLYEFSLLTKDDRLIKSVLSNAEKSSGVPVWMAYKAENFDILNYLLDEGFSASNTLNHLSKYGDLKMVKYLVSRGAYSPTASIWAYEHGFMDIYNYLVSEGFLDILKLDEDRRRRVLDYFRSEFAVNSDLHIYIRIGIAMLGVLGIVLYLFLCVLHNR